ncbi:hypothetical protein [Natronosalvus rutilus]|uniref:Uncharacterized protein n=1 Tax=Natronosalvus rutilus TaxID=2953753 RepID=A0A9E7N949_9EURY|nr:hypothetical protein [Natronosalvus rutilus]UTF52774.1 hypothetical protein NGM29_13405 [Natronosalvus rutilus]
MTNTQLLEDRILKNLEIASVPIQENTEKSLKITMQSKYGYEPEEVKESLSRLETQGLVENDSGVWRVKDVR